MNTNKLTATIPEGANALDLVLTGQWWEAWNKDKKEDYRELTPYWFTRLFEYDKKDKPTLLKLEFSKQEFYELLTGNNYDVFKYHKLKDFTHIRLSKAYAKDRPTGYVEFGGIEIREGKPEWGAKAGRLYFCIMRKGYKHGNKVL